ncbi:MAG: hypothetical protein J0H34_22575 [Rhizobiales bacterium]|nr:hypothetical protein [Hyphomicrobiales bacterium]
MGMVLSFQPRREQTSRPPIALPSAPSVVFFPGVRYERYASGDAAKPPPRALGAEKRNPVPPKS